MMEDEPSDVPYVPLSEPIAEVMDPVVTVLHENAEAAVNLAHESVETAQAAMHQSVEGISKTADETTKAFEEARGRLQNIGIDPRSGILDHFKSGTDALTSKLGASYARTSEHMATFNAKAIEAWRANAEATIMHWQRLAAVKSWSEMISLNAAHTGKQIETITAQTRELAELAGQLGQDAGHSVART